MPPISSPRCDVAVLRHYLAMPQTPLDLTALGRLQHQPVENSVVHRLVREMALRTARCFYCFSDPIIERTMRKPEAERLWSTRSHVLREFNYCVALHRGMAHCSQLGVFEDKTDVRFDQPQHRRDLPLFVHLRNTDDASLIDGPTDVARNGSSGGSAAGSAPAVSSAVSTSTRATAFRPLGSTAAAPATREDVEAAFSNWDNGSAAISLTLALKLLRPNQSLLDVMVNEAPIRSDGLNAWFMRFCRRRVAWRVLHEHLLVLTLPSETPLVISSDCHLVHLLQHASNAVVDIFADLVEGGTVHSLNIELEEDHRILTGAPPGTLVSSSTSHFACVADAAAKPPPTYSPSSTVFAVEGHLQYMFRELLKNACVATLRCQPDIHIRIRYASDDTWIVVDIVDEGDGIPSQDAKNIWKFGWTTSELYASQLGGFGVGLPTLKVYMDMWNGSVDMYSAPHRGTVVRVRFPRAPVEALVPEQTLRSTAKEVATA